MINYVTGNFDWNNELINSLNNKLRVALVFCESSEILNRWADEIEPRHGIVFRDFGQNRSSDEVIKDFKRLSSALVAVPLPEPIILTTHRLELMCNDVSRPDCIFVLPVNEFTANPIWRLTDKELRFSHNLQRMYIGGMFQFVRP